MLPFPRLRLPLLAACSLLAAPLAAQYAQAPVAPPLPGNLAADVVVSAEAAPAESDSLGVAATVIDQAEIERSAQLSLLEVLRRAPGLDVVQSGGPGGVASLFLRGTSSTQTLVLVDGVKRNSPFFGGFDLSTLATANVGRVEVVRGPFSALYGSEAIGGVVQVFSKRGGASGFTAKGFASYGSATTKEGAFTAAYSDKSVDVSAGFRRTLTDGDLPNGYFAATNLSSAVDVLISPDIRIGFVTQNDKGESGIPFSGSTPTPFRKTTSEEKTYSIPMTLVLGGSTTLEASASLAKAKPTFSDPDDPYGYTFSETDAERRSGRAVLSFEAGAQRIAVGGDYERADVTSVDAYGTQLQDASTDTWAAFVEDRISLSDGKLVFTAGLRRDDHSTFGDRWSPRLTASWAVTNGLRLRTAGGTGFRSPTAGELYYPFSGNPALEPEQSTSYEVGAEFALGRSGASFEATAFSTDVEDLIQYDFAAQTNVNVGKARMRGVEAVLTTPLSSTFAVRASYAWLDAVDQDTGLPLLRRPEHRGSATLSYATKKGVGAEVTALYVGQRDDVDAVTFERVTSPSYLRLDLAVTASKLLGAFGLYGRVTNLTDKEYSEVAGYPSPGRRYTVGLDLTY